MRQLTSIFIAACIAVTVSARQWTGPEGRTIEAEAVWIYPNRTVALKMESGKTVKVPFETFSTEDQLYLEHLLARQLAGRGMPHPVSWQEMNRMFGLEIWQDDLL